MRSNGRQRMTIGASLIVRDEAHHLPACLASIRELVDEIIVVDTGSVDGTVALARDAGAVVEEIEWPDDFSAARNRALALMRADWVLYIDADERVRPIDGRVLRQQLLDPALVAATVAFHVQTGYDAYRELRLFRNHPELRFRGVIHETIWPAVQHLVERDGCEVADTDLVVDHVGYDGPQDHKHPRNLPLLRKALAADPDHIYCWYHLGTTLDALGDEAGAEAAWREGIRALERVGPSRPADSLPYIELLIFELDRQRPVDALLQAARAQFPDDPMLHWLAGRHALQSGRHGDAVRIFEAVVLAEPTGSSSSSFGYDSRLFTSQTDAMLGTAHHLLGDHAAAARCFARAEARDPGNLEYHAKRVLNEHLAR